MKNSNEIHEHGQWFIRYRDKGDIRAFEHLMDVYHKPLFNYLLRILHNKETAEDALQEVWIKIIRQKEQYKDQGKFSSWAYRIAHNYCLDYFRKQNCRADSKEDAEDEKGNAYLDRISGDSPSPYDHIEEKELIQLVERTLKQLPMAIREVYLLRTYHQMPFKEIAEIQDAPLGTVLSRMNQAIKRIQPEIENYLQQSETSVKMA